MKAERVIRYLLKVFQLLFSIYLVCALFLTGPHWMLIAACMAVPIFGIYLMTQSPDQTKHPIPYVMYKALARSKSWQRVDVAVCLTMTIVCFGFSVILFIGYFKVYPSSPYFLHAAIASLILSILYCINALLTTGQLQSGTIDFSNETLFATISSKHGPLSIDTSYANESTVPVSSNSAYNIIQNRDPLSKRQENPITVKPRITPNSSDENFRVELSETLRAMELPSEPEEKSRSNMDENKGIWYYDSSGKREAYRNTNWSSLDSNMGPQLGNDPTGLDARERYIRAKQKRDFLRTDGSMSWNKRQVYMENLNKIENFNEKFAASGHSSGSEYDPRPSTSIPENYKPSTQPYTRRAIIPAFSSSDSNNRRISESSVTDSISSLGAKPPASILKRSSQNRGSPAGEERRNDGQEDEPSAIPSTSQYPNDHLMEDPLSTSHKTRLQPDEDSTYSVIISPKPYKLRNDAPQMAHPMRFSPPTSANNDCEVGPASSTSSYDEVSREDSPECDKSTTLVFFRGRKSPITTKVDEKNGKAEPSQASMDDYDQKYYSKDDREVQEALSSPINFSTEPLPPIASHIDSNRENEMRWNESLQRTSSRVRKRTDQKRGFEVLIRPRSAQFLGNN